MDLMIEKDHPFEPSIRRWSAELPDGLFVQLSFSFATDTPPFHFDLAVKGPTGPIVEEATNSFLNILADGKRAFIRVPPTKAVEHKDFETDTVWFESRTRFSVFTESGGWQMIMPASEEYSLASLRNEGRIN